MRMGEASTEEIPGVLREPPWLVEKKMRPKDPKPVLELTPILGAPPDDAVTAAMRSLSDYALRPDAPPKLSVLALDSPRLGLPIARRLSDLGIQQARWAFVARRWILTHPGAAVVGLVPFALGKSDNDRGHAWAALHHLARHGVDVAARAEPYGAEAQAAIAHVLAYDPRFDLPGRIPQLPPSYVAATLTPPRLRNGMTLPVAAVTALGTLVALSDPLAPHVGVAEVRAACDEVSLAEWAWDVARVWETTGAKDQLRWMTRGLVFFTTDELIRKMSTDMKSKNVMHALELIGTDAAVRELTAIAAREPAQRKLVDIHLTAIAESRGVVTLAS